MRGIPLPAVWIPRRCWSREDSVFVFRNKINFVMLLTRIGEKLSGN